MRGMGVADMSISNIDDYAVHKISEVICVGCGKRWICVRPEGTFLKDLECSNCGAGKVIETGEVMRYDDGEQT